MKSFIALIVGCILSYLVGYSRYEIRNKRIKAKFKEDLYFHVSLILALLYSLAISAEIGIIVDFVERIIGSTLWVLFWSPVIALSSAVLHFVVLRGIASFAESLKYYRLMKILRLRRRRRLQRMRAIRTARAHQ